MNNQKSTNWCFTVNNYREEDVAAIDALQCRYIIYGKEGKGEGKTPHLQGYIKWLHAKTFNATKSQFKTCNPHVEKANDPVAAMEYCKKEGDFKERGVPPMRPTEQGHHGKEGGEAEKRRWELALDEARTEGEVTDAQIQFTHCRTVDYIYNRELSKRQLVDSTEKNEWYYGATGTGKSRKARTENPEAFLKMANKWWDSYSDEDVVIIEDFDKAHTVLVHHMKIWADRYPFPAEVKGGSRKIRPKKIIVTSNYHPRDIWSDDSDLQPILRRFKIVYFPFEETPPSTPVGSDGVTPTPPLPRSREVIAVSSDSDSDEVHSVSDDE